MRLVSADKVVARLNVGRTVGTGQSTVIESALDGVTPIVEAVLGTSLLYAKRTDYFSHSRSIFTDYKPVTLRLAQRFAVARTVKVYVSLDANPITDVTDTTQAKLLVEGEDYLVDAQNGEVHMMATIPRGTRVCIINYTAGFDSESADIPSWLQQAAISAAVRVHHAQATAHNKKDTRDMSAELNKLMMAQLREHIRSGMNVEYCDHSLAK